MISLQTVLHRVHIIFQDGAKNAPTPRPNKKPRLESERKDVKQESKAGPKETAQSDEKEKDLEEFLKVMQPKTKKERTWQNDVQKEEVVPQTEEVLSEGEALNEGEVEEVDDLEWMRRRMKKDLSAAAEEKKFFQDEEMREAATSKVRAPIPVRIS